MSAQLQLSLKSYKVVNEGRADKPVPKNSSQSDLEVLNVILRIRLSINIYALTFA